MSWSRRLARMADFAERQLERATAPGPEGPAHVVFYRGFGTPTEIRVAGRVLRGVPAPPSPLTSSRWDNLVAALGRFESDEVPGARVRIEYGAAGEECVADPEGYFTARIASSPPPESTAAGLDWHPVRGELLSPAGPSAEGQILVPRAGARFGVISDLDDTVIRTGVRRVTRMLAATFLENARTRLPFPGVAAFYHALQAPQGGTAPSPIFYVSSSPWNLHDYLVEFLQVRGIPVGPLLLRDWGTSRDSLAPPPHHLHKGESIELVFRTYPDLPFILIGDSGQQDPEIYREMVIRHPGRVPAIYIREVTANPLRAAEVRRLAEEVRELGTAMVLVENTVEASRHAAEHGWIASERVDAVIRDLVETAQ
jgi:phosphatidate phosphatase APP1